MLGWIINSRIPTKRVKSDTYEMLCITSAVDVCIIFDQDKSTLTQATNCSGYTI